MVHRCGAGRTAAPQPPSEGKAHHTPPAHQRRFRQVGGGGAGPRGHMSPAAGPRPGGAAEAVAAGGSGSLARARPPRTRCFSGPASPGGWWERDEPRAGAAASPGSGGRGGGGDGGGTTTTEGGRRRQAGRLHHAGEEGRREGGRRRRGECGTGLGALGPRGAVAALGMPPRCGPGRAARVGRHTPRLLSGERPVSPRASSSCPAALGALWVPGCGGCWAPAGCGWRHRGPDRLPAAPPGLSVPGTLATSLYRAEATPVRRWL